MGNCGSSSNEENNKMSIDLFDNDSPSERSEHKKIEKIKAEIIDLTVFEREELAKIEYDKYIKNKKQIKDIENFMTEYLKIIRLVFINDTNKEIIKEYLTFIRENDKAINENGLKPYKKEIKKYQLLFTLEELDKIESEEEQKFRTKKICEKKKFTNLLESLKNIKSEIDINNFISNIVNESNKIKYFNYPIEFSNQELFYYKLYILLILGIIDVKSSNLYTEKEKIQYIYSRSAVAKLVLKKKVLDNPKIINNEDKMNILILLILYDILESEEGSINFNRLLQTESFSREEVIEYLKKNKYGNLLTFDNKGKIFIKEGESSKVHYEIEVNDVCIKNLGNQKIYNNDFSDLSKTLDSLLKKNDFIDFEERIKKFLVYIVKSKVYKEAIEQLFPNHYEYIIRKNLEDIITCIKHRFKFYPYQDLGNSGITDKFSCYAYIPTLVFDLSCSNKKFIPALECGMVTENSIHEINHLNQNIIFFKGNDKTLFHTPKREGFKEGDGGENLEDILFGEKKKSLKMLECFYILNEKNYKQSLNDFKTNFKKIADNSIKISEKMKYLKNNETNAIFKEFFALINNYNEEDFIKIELFYIKSKIGEDDSIEAEIFMPKEHCLIGFN